MFSVGVLPSLPTTSPKGKIVNFVLTKHAIKRLQERFPHLCKDFNSSPKTNKNDLIAFFPLFEKLIFEAKENNSFLNNTNFMFKLYEKHGFDSDYKLLELKNESLVFVMAKNRSDKIFRVITVMPNGYVPTVAHQKFSEKKKKEEIFKEKVLQAYDNYSDSIERFLAPEVVQKVNKKLVGCEDTIQMLIDNDQHKQINEDQYFVRNKDDILFFSLRRKIITNIEKYTLVDKQKEPKMKVKNQFFADLLDKKENVKLIMKFSNSLALFEFFYGEEKYNIVYFKDKNNITDKVKRLNKELEFLVEQLQKTD